ncbi:MAG TPA: class III extradiol ring-cleavage dioxygenase [Gammaproteobacteria bacterium]|nr:class III extradiol ring-cleavage dioxygenase [Gammaproteobacteria bacterium]
MSGTLKATQRLPHPVLFVSHGAPTLALDEAHPTHIFLKALGPGLPKAQAILVVSAHWDTEVPTVTGAVRHDTIHDFSGFPEPLYALRYPAPGAPSLARETAGLLQAAGFEARIDQNRGLDHGAWVPLMLMYPEAKVPVVQLSLQTRMGAEHHLKLGAALAPLRERGVLIVGSGGATHNLREFFRPAPGQDESYVKNFTKWLQTVLKKPDLASLKDYRRLAPDAARAHPTEEHFFPLLVAAGAASGPGQRIHDGMTGHSLAMDAYKFF